MFSRLYTSIPLIHTYRKVCRNSKYQPFLQMYELPVWCWDRYGVW